MTHRIFLTGGTGKTGRRVANRLKRQNIDVRIGSRSATPAFDWDDQSNWDTHLAGATAAYITHAPDVALPGALEQVEHFMTNALKHGVKRLVLLSGRGEDAAVKAENSLKASGADWTIVRASWFAQNFSEGLFAPNIAEGTVLFPRDGMLEPFIDADDIADIVTAALTDDRHIGQLYEVTGPRLMTFRQAFAEIAAVTGRPIHYVPVEIDEYLAAVRHAGVPDMYVSLLEILTREVLDGRNANTTDGVERALGRPATDFATFVAKAAAAGAWA